MFSLRWPTTHDLARIAARQAACELTYAEHGSTTGSRPAGYCHDEWETDLGSFDEATFDRLADSVCNWQMHRGAGLTVYPAVPARPGLTVAICVRLAGAFVTAAARVVYVTGEPGRRGFAYGTLPQHPEQGEEAFHVVRDGGRILFRVTAFSRPHHPLARLGAPASRLVQQRISQAYLRAMREATA